MYARRRQGRGAAGTQGETEITGISEMSFGVDRDGFETWCNAQTTPSFLDSTFDDGPIKDEPRSCATGSSLPFSAWPSLEHDGLSPTRERFQRLRLAISTA